MLHCSREDVGQRNGRGSRGNATYEVIHLAFGTNDNQALKEHLFIMENLLGRLSKSAIGRQSESFAVLLTKAFDLRRIQFAPRTEDSYEDNEVEDIEDAANSAAIALVTRINDTIFRPMFVRLIEWAASSSAKARVHRQTAIYKFFIQFFNRFKVWK